MRTKAWILSVMAMLGVFTATGCVGEDTSAFDESENDDSVGGEADGKADAVQAATYRSGCGDPIRTGKYALKGDIITPTGVVMNGYVVVQDEKIAEIRTSSQGAPAGVGVWDTKGVISPGLIDGHGHVEYNHIPIADLGKRYQNRDQWPGAKLYKTLVKDPKNAVTAAGIQCEALRHGEARGLVGGTTAIQGTPQTSCVRPLVRNLEQVNFCRDKVRQNVTGIVGFERSISGKPSFADSVKADIAARKVDTVVVHAGEGIDEHARSEWQMLKDQGLANENLVMIHATAFTRADFNEIAAAKAKIVFSPLSNLLLYGKTTDIPAALDAGVLVSIGADWAPSGSANLLGELKVADHVNKRLWNSKVTDQQLLEFATINPAKAFRMDKEVGSIEVGKYADFLVVKQQTGVSSYRSVINAKPQDVFLVTISGDPLFGTKAAMDTLGKGGDYELIDACGAERAIDMTVTAKDVSKPSASLMSIETALKKVNPKLTPVIDCTNDAALAAYKGIPALMN